MIKKYLFLFLSVIFFSFSSFANEEYNVTLDYDKQNSQTIELPYGNIIFSLAKNNSSKTVSVELENVTPNQAILVFQSSLPEPLLKKHKPKIEFEKTYPGGKGSRKVEGCRELLREFISIVPEQKVTVCDFKASENKTVTLSLPVYLAKYDAKKLLKKGQYYIPYKILSEEILDFNIYVKGWDENDAQYLDMKNKVNDFLISLQSAKFCDNRNHNPSLESQQAPYLERQDNLKKEIREILEQHPNWFSTDAPHIAYTSLLLSVENVNFSDYVADCKRHKVPIHNCNYCSLSANQIYHQLDDTYQQLRNGKITKDAAVKKVNALKNCYQTSKKRKKDASYTDKINKFSTRILDYKN